MIYEMRIYHCNPGRLPDLLQRFETATLAIWDRMGIRQVGFWIDEIGESNKLTYMLAWETLEERDRVWAAFLADPDWLAARDASEEEGPILARVVNSILRPTGFSKLN